MAVNDIHARAILVAGVTCIVAAARLLDFPFSIALVEKDTFRAEIILLQVNEKDF